MRLPINSNCKMPKRDKTNLEEPHLMLIVVAVLALKLLVWLVVHTVVLGSPSHPRQISHSVKH